MPILQAAKEATLEVMLMGGKNGLYVGKEGGYGRIHSKGDLLNFTQSCLPEEDKATQIGGGDDR